MGAYEDSSCGGLKGRRIIQVAAKTVIIAPRRGALGLLECLDDGGGVVGLNLG